MKIEREIKSPNLFDWIETNLPSSLKARTVGEGYGYGYYIYDRNNLPWFGRGNPIAEIEGRRIILFHTNYFPDMEDLAKKYEYETGCEVTLKYWQSPKDKPLS